MEAIGIGAIYPVIDILQKPDEVSYYSAKINAILPFTIKESRLLFYIIISIILLFIIKNAFTLFANYAQARFSNNLLSDWKNRIMKVYLAGSYSFFVSNPAGELLHKMMSQTSQAQQAILSLLTIIRMALTFIAIYITLCIMSFKITIVVTVVLAMVLVFFFTVSKKIVYKKGVRINQLEQSSYSLAAESIAGIRQIKMFVSEPWVLDKFTRMNSKLARLRAANSTVSSLPSPMLETLAGLGPSEHTFHYDPNSGKRNLRNACYGRVRRRSLQDVSHYFRDIIKLHGNFGPTALRKYCIRTLA